MVAQHSNRGEPPRQLSPETESLLEAALRAFGKREPGSEEALQEALRAAGAEGRQRDFRPEELVFVLKRIEERVEELSFRNESRADARLRMQRAMLEAYYRG